MTEEELIEWGRREDLERQRDIGTVDSQEALEAVQARAKLRREEVGLSVVQAFHWVKEAQRLRR